jgi:hypothetical protein
MPTTAPSAHGYASGVNDLLHAAGVVPDRVKSIHCSGNDLFTRTRLGHATPRTTILALNIKLTGRISQESPSLGPTVWRYPASEGSAQEAAVETDDVRLNPGCKLGFVEPVALGH